MSLYKDLVSHSLNRQNDNAILYKNKYVTYAQFLEKVDFYSDFFAKVMFFHKGMTISLCLENSITSLAIIYALNKIGVIINLINPKLPADQIIYFDSVVRSRILILEKEIYQKHNSDFYSKKDKIALIDNDTSYLKKAIRNFSYRKIIKQGIPLSFKHKNTVDNYDAIINDNDLAITCANEKFDEKPSVCCFTNENLHQSLLNTSNAYLKKDKQVAYIDGSVMSFSMLMSFYHPLLCNGVCINLNSEKTRYFTKAIKKHKISILCADEGHLKDIMINQKSRFALLYPYLDSAYIYNDINRTFIYDEWSKYGKTISHQVPLYSLLGTVENGGPFLFCELHEDIIMNFGNFLGDNKGHVDRVLKLSSVGPLYVKSNSNMLGYYKDTNKSDETKTKYGIKTGFRGAIDKDNNFHLLTATIKKQSFRNDSPYLFNLQEMLLTIPGVKEATVTTSLDLKNKIECLLDADKSETIRITNDVSEYLNSQFKDKDIDYSIKFKD